MVYALNMQTFPLGSFHVGRVGFGAMQLPGPGVFGPPRDRDEALAVLRRAIELGINHIDTAQFYGPNVANELIREALHPYPADLALVSKVGARRDDTGGVAARTGTRRTAGQHRGEPADAGHRPARRSQPSRTRRRCRPERTRRRSTANCSTASSTAMIKARDEGLIGGIGLSSIVIDH